MTDKTPKDTEKPEPSTQPMPTAGPHAKPELTNPDATPGAGSLPDEKTTDNADGGTG